MSALIGLADSAGRIPTSAAALTHFWRAMGFVGVALSVTVTIQPGAVFNGSVLVNPDGSVVVDTVSAITNHNGGIPVTATGALAVESAAPTYYSQGVGFTAAGRVSVII